MRRFLVPTLVCIAAWSAAQIKMDVQIAGQPSGTVTITQKLLADGSKSVQLAMSLRAPERKIRTESVYSKDGLPVRKFQETTVVGQRYRRQVTATFKDRSAHVVVDTNGVRETKEVPLLDDSASLVNLSEFWFVRDMPKKGTTIKTYSFDLETLEWHPSTITYVGPRDFKLGRKTIKAHHTRSDKGTALVDSKGLPLRLALPGALMDRIG